MRKNIDKRGSFIVATGFALFAVTAINIAAADMSSYCPDTTPDTTVREDILRILTLNASHGRKTAWNQMLVSKKRTYENLDLIASLLKESNADIVALQEADAPSRWSGKFDHVDYLRDKTEYRCSVMGGHADTWFFTFGTALLSKSRMSDVESVSFPATPPTTTKGFVKTSIAWDVQGKIVPVTIVSVHLDFSRKSVRDKQIGILVEELKDSESPLIVMGDLNSRWDQKRSHVQQLAEALDLSAYEPQNDLLGTYKIHRWQATGLDTSVQRSECFLVTRCCLT